MKKLIKIEIANSNVLRIVLSLTNKCTYSCRYCPDTLHKGNHSNLNLEELKLFFSKIKNRQTIITITGGECTIHPQFKEILYLIKEFNFVISVDTNAVRSLRFYKEVANLVDSWCITLHPSQHNLNLETIKILGNATHAVVLVAMDPDYWSTSIDWLDTLKSVNNIKVIPMYLISNWSGADCEINYSKEQLDFIQNYKSFNTFTEEKIKYLKLKSWLEDTDSIGTFDDGSKESIDPFQLIKENKNQFYGWNCYAGNEVILINVDSSVSWANCGYKFYKHFLEIDFEDLKKPVVCKFLKCNCGTDIRSSKEIR